MNQQEDEIGDMIEDEIRDMIDGTMANLLHQYLAIESFARDEVLLVEVEVEVEMEIDGQAMLITLTQTWSWVPDGVSVESVEALMQEDTDAEGDQYQVSVQQLMEDDADERFN